MAEREYHCTGCKTPHAAPLWFVHQVENNYGPLKADYLCGSAYSRLRPKWSLRTRQVVEKPFSIRIRRIARAMVRGSSIMYVSNSRKICSLRASTSASSESEVACCRLMQSQEVDARLVNLYIVGIDLLITLDDFLGQGIVALQESMHDAADLVFD